MHVIEEAKEKMYNSAIMQYVSENKLKDAFERIYVYKDRDEYLKEYGGYISSNSDKIEGFNNKKGSHFWEDDTTVHTVIHEILHGISSEFDKQEHRVKNGIKGNQELNFANMVNEGLTDYLAAKLSGEDPRHYIMGHNLFTKLEPLLIDYTKNQNILFQIYLNNDVDFLRNFLNDFGGNNTFEELYEKFYFMGDDKINNMTKNIAKGMHRYLNKRNRKEKIENLINKIKKVFSSKKVESLPPASGEPNSGESFLSGLKQENFESKMSGTAGTNPKEEQAQNSSQYSNGDADKRDHGCK